MEAIGVGANVLAFVVLGIKSAKLAHDTFSAIKDGPALVQNLAANFLQLHWILEHLLQCRAAAADTALHGQARQCCEDLDKLAKTIERLQVPPKEKAAGRFWKRLKTAISESDLKRLDKWVAGQASLLNLRLVVLSSNEIYAMRDGNERTQQQIHAIGASVKTQLESQTASFLGAARGITINHNDGRSALEAGLSSVQQKIEAAHSISVENTQSMFQLLKEIKDGNPPESNGADMANAVDGTLETIDRLCSLIDEKRDAVDAYAEDDDQAQSAIENLEKLVQSLREQELPVSDPESFSNDLSRFSKWFGSGALSINSGIGSSHRPFTRVVQQSLSFSKADIGAGKFHSMVHKRKLAIGIADQDGDETTAEERCHTDWTMTVAYLPGQGQNRHMVLASLARQGLSANRMTCISRLQVNRLLPAESPVFQLVKQGNLQGFKEMLQQGKASLQDHDEYGASLLFYSAEQPELCKFLIDSGLDIDHVATDYGCNEWEDDETQMVQVLQAVVGLDEDFDPELFQRITECRKLLLRAGADPTFSLDHASFLDRVHNQGSPESIRLVWNTDIVAPFADIKTHRNSWGMSSLLMSCQNYGRGYTKERFHQLLQLGADIRDRDNQGRTCLHICFANLNWPRGHSDLRQFLAIEYLLQQGADPWAVDNFGQSVSDVAYTTCGWLDTDCSYPGDLWDAVLHKCGYGISQFRSGHRRRARYSLPDHNARTGLKYNRQAFEASWKGREEECPYWDDKPWPTLGPGEEDSDDESQDHQCRCKKCLHSIPFHVGESDPELDTTDGEQKRPGDGSVGVCPHCISVDQGEEESEPDMEGSWEEASTLPGFGELMQGMSSEDWQDSPDFEHSIIGTPQSLSIDLENPWL